MDYIKISQAPFSDPKGEADTFTHSKKSLFRVRVCVYIYVRVCLFQTTGTFFFPTNSILFLLRLSLMFYGARLVATF